jgi:hypothetical protein
VSKIITKGIVYMSFGGRASRVVRRSYDSIISTNVPIRAIVVGDTSALGMEYSEWKSEFSKYDEKGQFLAGAIKPFLYNLSPFDYTLYLDADTTICGDIMPGFDFLENNDISVANHYNNLCIDTARNSSEKDETIKLLNSPVKIPFINSGVIFFKKSINTENLFKNWHTEWMKYCQWDEQLALHRAIHKCPETNVFYMPEIWNKKYKTPDTIIWHQMGSCAARK